VVFTFVVAGEKRAPREARQAVREHLEQALEQKLVADLELLLTEVVTNAVKYGGSERSTDIEVRVELSDELVSVSITDAGGGFRPGQPEGPRFGRQAGGFGLFLLDRLSTRWGVERDQGCFRVWFWLNR
jgi:anti-sigma regulatory factor (Ser/Thr protein kinase)